MRTATALAAVLASELVLQVLCLSPPIEAVVGNGPSPTIRDPLLGHRPNPVILSHDPAGFRNASRPARAPMVAVGDSQTYGESVNREQAWPQLLEGRAGVPTYNMAYGGYGPPHYLVLAREALTLRPELVLVGVYAGNDLADAYDMVYERGQLPELRSRDPALLRSLQAVAQAPGRRLEGPWEEAQRACWGAAPGGLRLFFSEHSKLYGLLRAARRWMGPARPQGLAGAMDWPEIRARADRVNAAILFAVDHGGLRTVLTPRARLAVLDQGDPRVREGYRISVESLRRIRDLLRGKASLLVVLIPTKELVFSDWLRARGGALPPALGDLAAQESAMWASMTRELDREGIEWVATLGALRELLNRGENPYSVDINGHPSVAGNRAIAEVVASSPAVQRVLARGYGNARVGTDPNRE